MAELTTLEEKLAEVTGLAMAAQGAGYEAEVVVGEPLVAKRPHEHAPHRLEILSNDPLAEFTHAPSV